MTQNSHFEALSQPIWWAGPPAHYERNPIDQPRLYTVHVVWTRALKRNNQHYHIRVYEWPIGMAHDQWSNEANFVPISVLLTSS